MAFGLKLGHHRPAQLTTSSTGSAGRTHGSQGSANGPLVSPVNKEHAGGRFHFFGKKRGSTGTSISGTTDGSFSSDNALFQMFPTKNEDDLFEYSRENGTFKDKTLPRGSDLTMVAVEEQGIRLPPVFVPRVSDLKAMKQSLSPSGAPVYIGKAAVTDTPVSRPQSPIETKTEADSEQEPWNFKQSCQSRNKVPEVVKKILKAAQPLEFEWENAPAYARSEQMGVDNDTDMDELEDIDEIPPPPSES